MSKNQAFNKVALKIEMVANGNYYPAYIKNFFFENADKLFKKGKHNYFFGFKSMYELS